MWSLQVHTVAPSILTCIELCRTRFVQLKADLVYRQLQVEDM